MLPSTTHPKIRYNQKKIRDAAVNPCRILCADESAPTEYRISQKQGYTQTHYLLPRSYYS